MSPPRPLLTLTPISMMRIDAIGTMTNILPIQCVSSSSAAPLILMTKVGGRMLQKWQTLCKILLWRNGTTPFRIQIRLRKSDRQDLCMESICREGNTTTPGAWAQTQWPSQRAHNSPELVNCTKSCKNLKDINVGGITIGNVLTGLNAVYLSITIFRPLVKEVTRTVSFLWRICSLKLIFHMYGRFPIPILLLRNKSSVLCVTSKEMAMAAFHRFEILHSFPDRSASASMR